MSLLDGGGDAIQFVGDLVFEIENLGQESVTAGKVVASQLVRNALQSLLNRIHSFFVTNPQQLDQSPLFGQCAPHLLLQTSLLPPVVEAHERPEDAFRDEERKGSEAADPEVKV